ncbi:MAG: DUF1285 domain-containing protein [Pseudomonadota bacterium]
MTKSNPAQNPVTAPSADALLASATKAAKKGPPPVHLWNPPFCGDLDMRIARDGTWFYEGTPIGRPAMVRLFASIMRKDGDDYVLVTPVEKVGLKVEDVPFIATDFEVSGQGAQQNVTFTTNVGDSVTAGPEAPLRVERDPVTGEPAPYVRVRAALEARIDRKSFYRLVDLCETEAHGGQDWFGLRSGGMFFPIIPQSELPDAALPQKG